MKCLFICWALCQAPYRPDLMESSQQFSETVIISLVSVLRSSEVTCPVGTSLVGVGARRLWRGRIYPDKQGFQNTRPTYRALRLTCL